MEGINKWVKKNIEGHLNWNIFRGQIEHDPPKAKLDIIARRKHNQQYEP